MTNAYSSSLHLDIRLKKQVDYYTKKIVFMMAVKTTNLKVILVFILFIS